MLAASADSGEVIISESVLEALGPEGYFINVARGKLVDEAALLDALTHKRIAGAGLDVFAHEPHVPEGFFTLNNVTLQPHCASATVQTRPRWATLCWRIWRPVLAATCRHTGYSHRF